MRPRSKFEPMSIGEMLGTVEPDHSYRQRIATIGHVSPDPVPHNFPALDRPTVLRRLPVSPRWEDVDPAVRAEIKADMMRFYQERLGQARADFAESLSMPHAERVARLEHHRRAQRHRSRPPFRDLTRSPPWTPHPPSTRRHLPMRDRARAWSVPSQCAWSTRTFAIRPPQR